MNLKRYFGDSHSIESYHQAMKRLEHLGRHDEMSESNATVHGHVRVFAPQPGREDQLGAQVTLRRERKSRVPRLVPVADPMLDHPAAEPGPRGPSKSLEGPSVIVIDDLCDDRGLDSGEPGPPANLTAVTTVPSRLYASSGTSSPRFWTLVAALGLTVMVGGGTALLLLHLHHRATPVHASATSGAPASAAAPNAPLSTSPSVTVTTSPPVPVLSAVSTGSNAAAYSVTRSPIELSLSATANCWVQVRTSANGSVIFTGILAPSDARSFTGSGTLWMRAGFPAGLQVSVDGEAVALPAGSNPYDLSFTQAPASAR